MLQKPEPVIVVDRFPALLDALLALLDGLSEAEWRLPTVAAGWSVKDIALHLLGDEMNILSGKRDAFSESFAAIDNWDELVAFINRRNAVWVEAMRRVSPQLLCDLLRYTGDQVNTYFSSLDLYALGGPVSWAGPQPAPVWLDVAREFTERWHHQQHIRDALGKAGAVEPYFLQPVLAAFVYALPVTYQKIDAAEGVCVSLTISGPAGGVWSILRQSGEWQLYLGKPDRPDAEVMLPEEFAWRLFTKGIHKDAAREHVQLRGDMNLAEKALDTLSIIA